MTEDSVTSGFRVQGVVIILNSISRECVASRFLVECVLQASMLHIGSSSVNGHCNVDQLCCCCCCRRA
jgi:hypothetical protein